MNVAIRIALATAVLAGLAPSQSGPPVEHDDPTALTHIHELLGETKEARDKLASEMASQAESLERALREVDAILDDEATPVRERMVIAARSMKAVLAAIDALLAHEPDTRDLYRTQVADVRKALYRARLVGSGGPGGSADARAREAREQHKELAAWLATAEDTPPEWRETFGQAFEVLVAMEGDDAQLSAQHQQVWEDTVAILAEVLGDIRATYMSDLASYHSLRRLRHSKEIQRQILRSGADLEGLRETSRQLRAAVDGLLPDKSGIVDAASKIKGLLDSSRENGPAAPARRSSSEERRRRLQEYAARAAQRFGRTED